MIFTTLSIILLAFCIIALAVYTGNLNKRLFLLTSGKKAANLESVIQSNNMTITSLTKKLELQQRMITAIQNDAMANVQNIGVVRFNPFKETGGSQSFAIALTDKKQNGVVISSLYGRERLNVFAKPIINGSSEYTLTDEEKHALQKTLTN